MKDFWISSGHHLLDHDENGRLVVTDEFLKAYLARPELVPPDDACAAERALHSSLLAEPRRKVSASELDALDDEDARENWRVMLAFRNRLISEPTLEAAYLNLVRGDLSGTPSLFLNQLTQVVLRNALDGCEDPHVVRAAELFFRPQRASVHDEMLLLADQEIIEEHEGQRANAPLLQMFAGPAVTELDVLEASNADGYFGRSDAFDMVLSFAGTEGRAGLARALEIWIAHLLGIHVSIEPVAKAEDTDWAWFVGLDAEATRIGNALWRGHEVGDDALDRIVGLFRLSFEESTVARSEIAGRPVWLFLATAPDKTIRLKPQNLITGLPLVEAS